ncbi:hypothetical protein Ciccas_009764 [Cichlidogyrus casuarinus]|uniref:Uncharacterized protein n=1 Tax=Cichlidogyrus casuarinus TaxID=1844966 RepID=A0ABD2PX41_9PLAT
MDGVGSNCNCEDMKTGMAKAIVLVSTLSSIYYEKMRQLRRIRMIQEIKRAAIDQANMQSLQDQFLQKLAGEAPVK